MFDFEKFPVYIKAEETYKTISTKFIRAGNIDQNIRDQLKRACLSIPLNIAEGAGKFSKNDKKNFYVIARGSTQECVAILRVLKIDNIISDTDYNSLYDNFTEISKMLSGLINTMLKK